MSFYNLARMYTDTTGTGTVTLTTAVPGCLTFALAGVTDGATVNYGIITYDLSTHQPTHSEVGSGTYTASGTTLARTTVEKSTNSNNKITLTGLSEVYLCPLASDFAGFGGGGGGVQFAKYIDLTTATITNGTNNATLKIDTESVDGNNLASVSGDVVTVAGTGQYYIHALVYIEGISAFNGRVRLFVDGPQNREKSEGFSTADGISYTTLELGYLCSFGSTNMTINMTLDNNLGESIVATVLELSIFKYS